MNIKTRIQKIANDTKTFVVDELPTVLIVASTAVIGWEIGKAYSRRGEDDLVVTPELRALMSTHAGYVSYHTKRGDYALMEMSMLQNHQHKD